MEVNLKELKISLDKTVFKEVPFNREKSINSVLMYKEDTKRFKTPKSFNYRTIDALGIIFCVAILFFVLNGMLSDQTTKHLKEKQANQPNKEVTKKSAIDGTIYTPPKQNENFSDMTKEEILTKMINSVDNFETAKGEFKIHYGNINNSNEYTLINYEISLKNMIGGISKETYNNGDGKESVGYNYYSGGFLWKLDETTKTYRMAKYLPPPKGEKLTINQAFRTNSEGENVTDLRERPPIGQAMSTLFPYEIASNYTRNLNDWNIEKQNEKLLGHNTIVIKGKLNQRILRSFRFWVDKDTGILVKYEAYNSSGKVEDYLYPNSLQINVPIESKDFKPNLTNFKNANLQEKNAPALITENIKNDIPIEIKDKWDEAGKKPNETTTIQFNNNWYIFVKKGYLVDRIEVSGKNGILYLAKLPPQKASSSNYTSIAERYNVDSLKIVYE